jgi:hypothetical protein
MGGVGLALLAEYLANRLRGPEEVERLLRLPSLGTVPESLQLEAYEHSAFPGRRTTEDHPLHEQQ